MKSRILFRQLVYMRGLYISFVSILLSLASACDRKPAPGPLARLEPVLRGDLAYVVAPLPDDQGFSLTISPSEKLSESMRAKVSVFAVDGQAIPYHLFDCHDTRKQTLDRSPVVAISPGTVRFCSLFVPSAKRVRRIVLQPEGRPALDFYRLGDPLGPVPLSLAKPPRIEYLLAGQTPGPEGSPKALEQCAHDRRPASPGAMACKRWRLALQEACGSTDKQPSFVDPCRCMCDRCLSDADCKAKPDGKCIQLPSDLSGGNPESVCVFPGDACGGDNPVCPEGKFCWTADGRPECVKPFDSGR